MFVLHELHDGLSDLFLQHGNGSQRPCRAIMFERQRQWDSCFNLEFSYMNGGIVRDNTRNRYRQWMTHKLATWIDQFGSSGCVGCGRCIAWCPVGIDLTEEVAAIREDQP